MTEVAELEQPTETAVVLAPKARAELALGTTKTEADLRALAVKHASIVAIVDKAGREQAHGAAMEILRTRTSIEKVSKAAREDATKFSKAVIAEEGRLIELIKPEEMRLLALRDAWDDEQARIKAEQEAAERARVAKIHERIAEIKNYATLVAGCRTSARIAELLTKLNAVDMEGFGEWHDTAAEAHINTVGAVLRILAAKQEAETEAARVKAEQEAETARLADEAAKLAEASEQLARDRADLERQRAALAPAPAPTAEPAKAVEPVKTFDDEVSEYAAAVIPTTAVPPVVIAVPVAYARIMERMLPEPWHPSALQMINAVAAAFSVPNGVAAEWLADAADEIANFD